MRVPEAYPLYDRNYKDTVQRSLRWLSDQLLNLFPVGRNALFRLDNMNHAFTMGIDLARRIDAADDAVAWRRSLERYEGFSYID